MKQITLIVVLAIAAHSLAFRSYAGTLSQGGFTLLDSFLCEDALSQEKDCGEKKWGPKDVEFTLKGGIKAKVRITRFAKCIKIEFLDKEGKPLPQSGGSLDEDQQQKAGEGKKVLGYSLKSSGTPVSADSKHWGMLRVFIVQGCQRGYKFFQFVRQKTEIPRISASAWSPWNSDGPEGKTYRGSFDGEKGDSGIMFDGPGFTGKDPGAAFGKIIEQIQPQLKNGDKAKVTIEFQTFVCCDEVLLGYFEWGYILTYTFDGKKWSEPVPDITPVRWNVDVKDNPNVEKVKCK